MGTVIKLTSAILSSYKINKKLEDNKEILNLLLFRQKFLHEKRVNIPFWREVISLKIISIKKSLNGFTSKVEYLKKFSFCLEYLLQVFGIYLQQLSFFLHCMFLVILKFFQVWLGLLWLVLWVKVYLIVEFFFFFIWFKVVPLKSSFLFLTFLHFKNILKVY